MFNSLPALTQRFAKTGRPIERNALLKALVYKSLRGLFTLPNSVLEINNNPDMVQILGLNAVISDTLIK